MFVGDEELSTVLGAAAARVTSAVSAMGQDGWLT
jgi:hypothetical protein